MRAWAGVLAGLLLMPLTGWGEEPKQPDSLQFVALKDYAIQDIALAPDGRILAATHAGVWEVSGDGSKASPLTGAGLPRPTEKCFMGQVVVNSKGAVFAAVGSGGHGGTDGVYRLNPGSGSWEQVGKETLVHAKSREAVVALAVLPDDTLFCSVQNVSMYAGESRLAKLFRSTSAGDSWEDTSDDESRCYYYGPIVAGPQRQMWMIAGEHDPLDVNNCWMLVTDDWRATPIKWRASTVQPGNQPLAKDFGSHEVVTTRVALDGKGNAFALVTRGASPYKAGVYRSTDKGGSWQRMTPDAPAGQSLAMAISPNDDVYVSGNGGVQRSQDAGATWAGYSGTGSYVTDLLVDHEGYVWASASGLGLTTANPGLFRTKAPAGAGAGTHTAKTPPGPNVETPHPPAHGDIEGTWNMNANGFDHKLEVSRSGNGYTGRMTNDKGGWDTLEGVTFDPATGAVEFTRPRAKFGVPDQVFKGTMKGDKITGGFGSAPDMKKGAGAWSATRDKDATPGTDTPTTDATPHSTTPPPDSKEPATVTAMTIQAGARKARPDEVVTVPVWLLHAAGVASLNVSLSYDPKVVAVSGTVVKGNLLGSTMFEANAREAGLIRLGFAQSRDMSGTGTLAQISFKAVGRPGDRTTLRIEVTSIASAAGARPKVAVIEGEVVVVDPNGVLPGDTNGNGEIEAVDAMNALKMSVGNLAVNMAADMDKDKQVTARDATLILQAVVGK